jgi:streptogramin lyase
MRSVTFAIMTLALGGFLRPAHAVWAQAPAASGTVITIAGIGPPVGFSGDGGLATNAGMFPFTMDLGPDGTLYISDYGNYRVCAVDPTTGIVSTVAGNGSNGNTGRLGPAASAKSAFVNGVAIVGARSLSIVDIFHNRIRPTFAC